jgi:hypothetical protein
MRQRLPAAAGILYSSAGLVLLIGIITAETTYPIFRHFTTRQEISDLGGTRPPHGLVTQPRLAALGEARQHLGLAPETHA